ncbi:MAG: hypothetical protein AAF449_05395, partial [Myxococcota bacterium]
LAIGATAFSPSPAARQTSQLNLFGGGGGAKPDAGGNQQPGMMQQMAMFKKAQEIAQKKKEIETWGSQWDT